MIMIILASALLGLPTTDEAGARPSSPSSAAAAEAAAAAAAEAAATAPVDASTPGFSRFSEPGLTKGGESASSKAKKAADTKKKQLQDMATKKAVDKAREETLEMLDEVRGAISKMEKGEPATPDVSVLPPQRDESARRCDVDLPQILAFEMQRTRAVRDEAQLMLDMHEKNLEEIESKLTELKTARLELDKSRTLLEDTLSRKSVVDDSKEKERRRLRLLMSSRAMKPKKIAALMEEISIEEARVLLESLPENLAKGVLEALSPSRLSLIVSSRRSNEEATTTSSKPKENL